MKAQEQPLRFICNEECLEIPFFQRPYVWHNENWEDLLEDLLKTHGNHFLGSIILKRNSRRTGINDKAIVVDGQQRLTTLSILIKAMYDAIPQKTYNMNNDAISALFYPLRNDSSNYQISLKHSFNDRTQYNDIMGYVVTTEDKGIITSPLKDKLDSISDDDNHLLLNCYKYFYTQLKEKETTDPGCVRDLWDSLFDKNNNILVVIDLDDNDQEQKIFDTINSSGVKLTATDIIKNYLFQKLIELTKDETTICDFYNATWTETFTKDQNQIEYWGKQKNVGRYLRDNSELLLQAFGIIYKYTDESGKNKSIFDVENDKLEDLAEKYKNYISSITDSEKLKDFIVELCDFAVIYKEHIPELDTTTYYNFNDIENRVAHILVVSENTTFNPYLLYLYKQYSGDLTKLHSRLEVLEKFIMYFIITKKSNKNLNKHCSDLINNDSNDITFNKYVEPYTTLTKDEILAGIKSKVSNKNASIILFWIELFRRTKGCWEVTELQYNFQLEHIMPQKWEQNWNSKVLPYVDSNNNIITDELEGMANRQEKIYSLGNMTLLNGKLNASISNNDFNTKLEGVHGQKGKKDRNGIKQYAALSITRDDIINKSVWNEYTISEREKALAEEIFEIWGK